MSIILVKDDDSDLYSHGLFNDLQSSTFLIKE
jgi:hypothetical protein